LARYAAFLRGINVGGRRVKADALCAPFAELGFDAVSSFRASGNVVFDATRKPAAERVEAGLEKALGYEVAVFLRTRAELLELAAARPFDSDGKYHVIFLRRLPPAATQDEALALATRTDRLAFGPRELLWQPAGRMMDAEIDLQKVTKLIGLNTMRTNGTVEQIAAKYFSAA
jgi:uncharacterized protein (DUF1697 family)